MNIDITIKLEDRVMDILQKLVVLGGTANKITTDNKPKETELEEKPVVAEKEVEQKQKQSHTIETLRKITSKVAKEKGKDKVKEILESFNVSSVSTLDAKDYDEYYKKVSDLDE